MAYTSEIEKLEKRWAENPKGRNFAPLADAYRKAGELDRAIELCTAGLELHPDYVSAHIVLGRCLMDQKNDPGASDVFRKVLVLDPENVLALKILADIAERGHRYAEAVDWLTRLLNADPMNGDAAEALTRARSRAVQSAGQSSPLPVAAPVRAAAPEQVVRLVPEPPPPPRRDFVVEHESEARVADVVPAKAAPPSGEIETYDGTLDFNSVAHDAAKAEGLEVQEEVELKPQDLVVEGLAHTQYESALAPPPGVPDPDDEQPTIDLPLIMPDDEPAPPVAGAAPPVAAAQRAPAAPAGAAPATPAAVTLSDDDGAADTAALSRAEPVVTETMAELYLRQGHRDEALHVYQALLAQRPGDQRLRARVAGLASGDSRASGAETGESVPTFLRRILAGRPPVGRPVASPDPAPLPLPESSGSLLDGAFAIAPPELDPVPEIVSPGEASRPADDSITLDAVFGEESPHSAVATDASAPPPEEPAPATAPPPPGGFSFDQFFTPPSAPAPPAGGPPGAEGGAAPAGPARGSGSRVRPPMEDEGDLDQFQAWLRGLKS